MDEKQPLNKEPLTSKSTKKKTATPSSKTLQAGMVSSRMPTDDRIQHILHERSLQLASTVREGESIVREAFVCIRLGLAERYGITYSCLEHYSATSCLDS